MLLIELIIDNKSYYVSNEQLNLTHAWNGYVSSFSAPSYDLSKTYGGYCKLSFGTIGLLPSFFVDHEFGIPSPKEIDLIVKHTLSTEAAAIVIFTGKGFLESFTRDEIQYELYEDIRTVNVLHEVIGYDESGVETDNENLKVELPIALGTVVHHSPVRLADSDGYPTYHLAHIAGDPCKYISDITNNVSGKCRVTCASHGYSTGNTVNIDTSTYQGSSVITRIDADTFDTTIDYETNRYYKVLVRRKGTCSSASSFKVKLNSTDSINGSHEVDGLDSTDQFGFGQSIAFFVLTTPAASLTVTITASNSLELVIDTITLVQCTSDFIPSSGNLLINSDFSNTTTSWTLGADWTIDETQNHAVYSGSSLTSISQAIDIVAQVGQAYTDDQYCVYDDGVAITSNVIANDDNTFSLDASAVGEVTIRGMSNYNTLNAVFGMACDENHLALQLNTTNARDTSPTVAYLLNSQSLVTDFLDNIASFYNHMFYIDWQTGSQDINILSSSYTWTESTTTAGEYYLTNANGFDPQKRKPIAISYDLSDFQEGAIGSLDADQWAYNDNDNLGFNTIYIGSNPASASTLTAQYDGTLYLIDMQADVDTIDLTEFDFLFAEYKMPDPIARFVTQWTERKAVEETTGLFVKDYDNELSCNTTYSYGSDEDVTAYITEKSSLKSYLNDLIACVEKFQIDITMPIDAGNLSSLPFGVKFNWTDTAMYAIISSASMHARSIQYNFFDDEVTISGEGLIE